jgi:hypothetical protein
MHLQHTHCIAATVQMLPFLCCSVHICYQVIIVGDTARKTAEEGERVLIKESAVDAPFQCATVKDVHEHK